jgi:hypothetical protein
MQRQISPPFVQTFLCDRRDASAQRSLNHLVKICGYRIPVVIEQGGYTGKVVPFKTQEGKYGLVKVVHADQKDDGSIQISIKVQK